MVTFLFKYEYNYTNIMQKYFFFKNIRESGLRSNRFGTPSFKKNSNNHTDYRYLLAFALVNNIKTLQRVILIYLLFTCFYDAPLN